MGRQLTGAPLSQRFYKLLYALFSSEYDPTRCSYKPIRDTNKVSDVLALIDEVSATDFESRRERAEREKEKGNVAFGKGRFRRASKHFTQALILVGLVICLPRALPKSNPNNHPIAIGPRLSGIPSQQSSSISKAGKVSLFYFSVVSVCPCPLFHLQVRKSRSGLYHLYQSRAEVSIRIFGRRRFSFGVDPSLFFTEIPKRCSDALWQERVWALW